MPGLQCSYGDVTRLDLPMPFFLRDCAFNDFKNENYSWEAKENVTVLVKCNRKRPSTKSSAGSLNVSQSGDDSIGGCPLECPFDPNENFEEVLRPLEPPPVFYGLDFATDQYEPMDLATCRGLVKKIYEEDESTVHSLCLDRVGGKRTYTSPIYVACDGSPNAKDLVMIGFNDEKFLELRMMGPYKRQSTQLNLELFLAYHQHLPNVNPAAIFRQVHAVYEKIHGEYTSMGKVYMEFVWDDPKTLFESPPATSARAKLAIQPKAGDANPCVQKLWQEIRVLDRLMEMWSTTKTNEVDVSNLSMSISGSDGSPLIEELKDLLNHQSGPSWKKTGVEYSDSMDDVLKRVIYLERHDVDFIDRAWGILQQALTWQELIECFQIMLGYVEAKMHRPYLLPSNPTMLGELLTGVMNGKISNYKTKLNPSTVIEMALDCGLNKLYKDYAFILGTCHLADPRECKVLMPQRQLTKESLESIRKLHCIMEVVCLSKERLGLSIPELENQTRKMLSHFSKHPLDWNKTFHFDVAMGSVAATLPGLHPVYWNLKLESFSTLRVARTNAILARDFFIGHAKKFYVTPEGTLPRGYYLYVHRIAQRKM